MRPPALMMSLVAAIVCVATTAGAQERSNRGLTVVPSFGAGMGIEMREPDRGELWSTNSDIFLMTLGASIHPSPGTYLGGMGSGYLSVGLDLEFHWQGDAFAGTFASPMFRAGLAWLATEPHDVHYVSVMFPAVQAYAAVGGRWPQHGRPSALRAGLGLSSPLANGLLLPIMGETGIWIPSSIEALIEVEPGGQTGFLFRLATAF